MERGCSDVIDTTYVSQQRQWLSRVLAVVKAAKAREDDRRGYFRVAMCHASEAHKLVYVKAGLSYNHMRRIMRVGGEEMGDVGCSTSPPGPDNW